MLKLCCRFKLWSLSFGSVPLFEMFEPSINVSDFANFKLFQTWNWILVFTNHLSFLLSIIQAKVEQPFTVQNLSYWCALSFSSLRVVGKATLDGKIYHHPLATHEMDENLGVGHDIAMHATHESSNHYAGFIAS